MQFQLTRAQIIFLSVAGVLALVTVLIFTGVLPGRRTTEPTIEITMWGVDDVKAWKNTIQSFRSLYGAHIVIKYLEVDESEYEEKLVNAMAAGEGPDIFMFDSNWLLEHRDKINPVPLENMDLTTFRGLFPQVAEEDLVLGGQIYALPLSADTLVMVYNRDYFDQSSVVLPPTTWAELAEMIPKLKREDNGRLERAAVAIGGSGSNIEHAADLINLFIVQRGQEMVDSKLRSASFSGQVGRAAFSSYLEFSDPKSSVYTWNQSFRPSQEAFARGETAITFVYRNELGELRTRAPFVDIGIAAMPQLAPGAPVNVADYWALAVSNKTNRPSLAWQFAVFATTNRKVAEAYSQTAGKSPALRSLINDQLNDPDLGVFAAQALTARSWLRPDEEEIDAIFSSAVDSVLSGDLTSNQALSRAGSSVTKLYRED